MTSKNKKPVDLVLLGGGHTNTQLIKHIRRRSVPNHVHLTLVSDYDTSLYSGMCPGGVAEQYTESQFSVDLIGCCHKLQWTFICKKIIEIDDIKQELIASDGTRISYDILSIDIGSTNAGLDTLYGIQQYAISTRPLKLLMDRVNRKESEMLQKLKQRCNAVSSSLVANHGNNNCNQIAVNVITVGGGCAGCELAMGITQRLRRKINPLITDSVSIVLRSILITNGDAILSRDPKALQSAVSEAMRSRNIEIKTSHRVIRIDKNWVYLLSKYNNDLITMPHDICIFATGAAPHSLRTHKIARDDRGWFKVNRHLQSISHSNIFGAGDCITMMDDNGYFDPSFPPKSGVYAVRQGPVLIHNVMQYLRSIADENRKNGRNLKMKEYVPQSDFLRLINTGDGKGIGCKHNIAFQGAWCWKLKDWIDVSWMNKFSVEQLRVKERKEFKPMMNNSKQDIKGNEWTVEEAVKYLSVDDEPDECGGFAKQWGILLKMAEDVVFCQKVVDAYNLSRTLKRMSSSKL